MAGGLSRIIVGANLGGKALLEQIFHEMRVVKDTV
jgi:hypothetical protein